MPKFSVVDLYLGNGYQKEVFTPNIVGFNITQVKQKLNTHSLNLGHCHVKDSNAILNGTIYQQHPVFNTKVPIGDFITVWVSDTLIND